MKRKPRILLGVLAIVCVAGIVFAQPRLQNSVSGGISLSWDLFNGWATTARESRARYQSKVAELNLRQPHEIEFYTGIFERQAAVASYGASARGIIHRAIGDVSRSAALEE